MPGEWRQEPFSSAVLIHPPVRLKRGCEYPFVSMDAIGPGSRWVYASRQRAYEGGGSRFQDGDTLLARITPCLENGKIARFKASGYISVAHGSTELIVIRGRAGVTDTGFAYYLTQSPLVRGYAISQMTGTSGRQRVPIEAFEHLLVPIPPLPEQRAIAHILGTLDDKIELNRRMNETLEAMAQAMFKSWFIDFDPVRAKAEGRDTGLPPDVAALFPDSFEDSELGRIPKGWKVRKLAELCSTQYGYTASAESDPVGPKYLRVTDINKRDWIEWSDVPYCSIDAHARNAYALHVGDLVVARMADPGKSAIVEDEVDAVFASYLVRLKTASLANSYYIYGFLKSDAYVEYATGARRGSVQANMNAKVIVDVALAVPPPTLMQQYLDTVLPLRQRLTANCHESHILAAFRDTLLPKLLSGELRADDVGDVTAASG